MIVGIYELLIINRQNITMNTEIHLIDNGFNAQAIVTGKMSRLVGLMMVAYVQSKDFHILIEEFLLVYIDYKQKQSLKSATQEKELILGGKKVD